MRQARERTRNRCRNRRVGKSIYSGLYRCGERGKLTFMRRLRCALSNLAAMGAAAAADARAD